MPAPSAAHDLEGQVLAAHHLRIALNEMRDPPSAIPVFEDRADQLNDHARDWRSMPVALGHVILANDAFDSVTRALDYSRRSLKKSCSSATPWVSQNRPSYRTGELVVACQFAEPTDDDDSTT